MSVMSMGIPPAVTFGKQSNELIRLGLNFCLKMQFSDQHPKVLPRLAPNFKWASNQN